jgi:hypothetical protein
LEADGVTLRIGDPCVGVEKQSAEPSRPRSAVVVRLKSGAVVSADRLLVATGRRANAEAWSATGLAQTEHGWLKLGPSTLQARAKRPRKARSKRSVFADKGRRLPTRSPDHELRSPRYPPHALCTSVRA